MLLGPTILQPDYIAEVLMPLVADILDVALPVILVGLFVGLWIYQWRKIARLKAMDFRWYAATYPACIEGERVWCRSCGGTHIRTERLMGRTFLRRHFCGRCGTTLYYSPEN